LRLRYYEGTRAPWAAEMLEDQAEPEFGLRPLAGLDISEGGNESRKSPIFKAVNDLFAYYSIVEVASLAGCMPEPLPEELSRSVQKAFSSQDFQLLCQQQARLLPILLRRRLEGTPVPRKPSDEGRRAFAAFLDINAMIEEDLEVEIFSRYLSLEVVDGYDLNDLASLMRRPSELMRRLAPDTGSNESLGLDGLDIALHGFRSFLIFAQRFDSLIRACSDDPILRSAFWLFHAEQQKSLFDGRRIWRFVERVLDNLSTWAEAGKAEMFMENMHSGVSCEESLESLEECRWMLERLTSGRYGRPINDMLNELVEERKVRATSVDERERVAEPQEGASHPPSGRRTNRRSEPEG